MDKAFSDSGIYAGDVALMYFTDDVLPDDLAAVEVKDETWLGTYRPAPGAEDRYY